MRSLLGFICLLLIGLTACMACMLARPELNGRRWEQRVVQANKMEKLNRDVRAAFQYSKTMNEAVRMLVVENGLLCERDLKLTQAYLQLEEENRSLKVSLSDAVKKLAEQSADINKLIEENEKLTWRSGLLERQVNVLEKALEQAVEPQAIDDALKQGILTGIKTFTAIRILTP